MSPRSSAEPPAQRDGSPPRSDRALLEVVEQIAIMLSDAGLPRMPARVFAYVLAEDSDRYTARELAEGLQVSAAAISGAVRLLVQTGMLARAREPGARSDHYLIDDRDVWSTIMFQRLDILQRWEERLADAVARLGIDSRGGRRLLETQAYFRFVLGEFPALQERWHAHKDELVAEVAAEHRS